MSAPIGNTDGIKVCKHGVDLKVYACPECAKEEREAYEAWSKERESRRSGQCAFNCSRGFHEADSESRNLSVNDVHGNIVMIKGQFCKYCRCYFEERT